MAGLKQRVKEVKKVEGAAKVHTSHPECAVELLGPTTEPDIPLSRYTSYDITFLHITCINCFLKYLFYNVTRWMVGSGRVGGRAFCSSLGEVEVVGLGARRSHSWLRLTCILQFVTEESGFHSGSGITAGLVGGATDDHES